MHAAGALLLQQLPGGRHAEQVEALFRFDVNQSTRCKPLLLLQQVAASRVQACGERWVEEHHVETALLCIVLQPVKRAALYQLQPGGFQQLRVFPNRGGRLTIGFKGHHATGAARESLKPERAAAGK